MTIEIDLEFRRIELSKTDQYLANAANSRHQLRNQFKVLISQENYGYKSAGSLQLHENTLKLMIVKYSEQLVYQPLEEIQYWFAYSSGAFLQPGYPPLFYSRAEKKTVSPNKSAVAGIGEGVAGFLAQRLYKCHKLARPNHDFPDIVMEANGKTYLVESKATLASSDSYIKQVVEDEVINISSYASSCKQLDTRPVVALLIGTNLVSETNYQCLITEINV